MTRHLLVAVNGGERSAAALDWSIHWAVTHSMSIELCTVVDDGWAAEDYPAIEKAHQRVLDAARERVEIEAPHLVASSVLHRGSLVEALVHLAAHSDVLVVGSRKSAMLEGAIHGTLALKVAERITRPLVAVPEGWTSGDGRIVVGVDDETDADAVEFAARAAESTSSALTLVRAVAEPVYYSPYDFGGRWELLQELRQYSERMLADRSASLRKAHPGILVDELVDVGRASQLMVRASGGASLAVVGTHARGVVLGMLLGSVGRDLLMNMPCPVTVVPLAAPNRPDDDVALMTSLAQ